ncbi:MAG: hypothetical protein PWQ41_1802 [Bacillota bacterium]|jgi:hypothetical protein|nr:hypothetical protein [Bacillota bacterium]MDK2856526.1 hypothetical protein [Bacillota bacterium]MDK2926028.1 hypothetical protein [Bacillota bacterium]
MLRTGSKFGGHHGHLAARRLSRLTPSLQVPPVLLAAGKVEAGKEARGPTFAMQTAGAAIPDWLD